MMVAGWTLGELAIVPEVEEIARVRETVDKKLEKVSDEEESSMQKVDLRSYTLDMHPKEIVEKMAKQIKHEVNLVQMFKEGYVPEETFTRLFNNMTNEIPVLIARRDEVTKELSCLIKGYESTVLSAQQGMKLLDLQKSFDDITEEEYKVKTAALNWDVNHYGEKISAGRLMSDYLRSIGGFIPIEEVNDLKKIAADCMNTSSMKKINEIAREKIRKAMHEASSLLNEICSS